MSTTTKQAIQHLQTILHKLDYPLPETMPEDLLTVISVSEVYDVLHILECYEEQNDEMSEKVRELENELGQSCLAEELESLEDELGELNLKYNQLYAEHQKLLVKGAIAS